MSRDGMIVYWCELEGDALVPCVQHFPEGEGQLSKLLAFCAKLRDEGKMFITSTSHHNSPGDIVKDGKLPNGQPYTWKKRRP